MLQPRRPWTLVKIVVAEALADRLTAEAARAAYYFFLSLFPAILALFALTGIFGGDAAFEWIMSWLRTTLPGDAAGYLERFVQEVTGQSRPGILSFSILFTLWSASNVVVALTDGLNRMYDLEDLRSWWLQRLVALAVVIVGAVLLIGNAVALLAGPELLELVGAAGFWSVLRWPLAMVLLVAMTWLLYLVLPERSCRGAALPTLAGAAVGTGLWLLATWGFRVYVRSFGSYDQTYGFVGGIIVLMLWLYLTSLAILFGGEVAATLEQHGNDAWDIGQPPPEA
jgi:membrane protein